MSEEMTEDWLSSLTPTIRTKAQKMIERMKELGALDAEEWVESEITEDIPQMARFLILRCLWSEMDMWRDDTDNLLKHVLAEAERNPKGYFAEAGRAIQRMLAAGVAVEDIGCVARVAAYEGMLSLVQVIDNGGDPEAGDDLPGWALVEVDANGEGTGRVVDALHESIFEFGPEGDER
jgi:hypothetical protein